MTKIATVFAVLLSLVHFGFEISGFNAPPVQQSYGGPK